MEQQASIWYDLTETQVTIETPAQNSPNYQHFKEMKIRIADEEQASFIKLICRQPLHYLGTLRIFSL
jgi:hypothetical protein